MQVTRDDVNLMVEALDLEEAFLAAKAAHQEDPDHAGLKAVYDEAKKAMSEHRIYWRRIREAVGHPEPPEGTAEVRTVPINVAAHISQEA